jgi:hypothetical protein
MHFVQRSQFPRQLAGFILACLLCGFAGCGEKGAYTGPKGTVRGKVTYKGKPISEGATVTFKAEESGGWTASGVVRSGGEYTIKTSAGDRLPVGKYKVVILGKPADNVQMSPEAAMKAMQAGKTFEDKNPDIPARYRDFSTTTEEFTLKEGPNECNIDMDD